MSTGDTLPSQANKTQCHDRKYGKFTIIFITEELQTLWKIDEGSVLGEIIYSYYTKYSIRKMAYIEPQICNEPLVNCACKQVLFNQKKKQCSYKTRVFT